MAFRQRSVSVFHIQNISSQDISIFVEKNIQNNGILEGFSGYFKIRPGSLLIIEQRRVSGAKLELLNQQRPKIIELKRSRKTVFDFLPFESSSSTSSTSTSTSTTSTSSSSSSSTSTSTSTTSSSSSSTTSTTSTSTTTSTSSTSTTTSTTSSSSSSSFES